MKKIWIIGLILIIIAICFGIYLSVENNKKLNTVEPMVYQNVLKNLDNPKYYGLEKYFTIEYDKPVIKKTYRDGRKEIILGYSIYFKNISHKKQNLSVSLYYENEKYASVFYEHDVISSNDRFVEVNKDKTYGTSVSFTIADPDTYEDAKKEFFHNNYGKLICYCTIKDDEAKTRKDFIQVIDVTK